MEEIIVKENEDVKLKNNKKTSGIIIAVVIGVILFGVVLGLLVSNSNSEGKLQPTNLKLSTEYNEYLGYSASVSGLIKNTTNHDFSYVSIEFAIYDSSGNNLGTALDNINNLLAGDTWSFEATLFNFPSTKPVSYKLIEINAW